MERIGRKMNIRKSSFKVFGFKGGDWTWSVSYFITCNAYHPAPSIYVGHLCILCSSDQTNRIFTCYFKWRANCSYHRYISEQFEKLLVAERESIYAANEEHRIVSMLTPASGRGKWASNHQCMRKQFFKVFEGAIHMPLFNHLLSFVSLLHPPSVKVWDLEVDVCMKTKCIGPKL